MENQNEWIGPSGEKEVREPSGVYYKVTTPRAVIDALESARRSQARVRLFYGDAKTGESWHEENGCTGRVGNSTGRNKIPILCANSRSMGGGAILTDCIVRMLVNGREVYRHPKYRVPITEIVPLGSITHDGYVWLVKINGKDFAQFKSEAAAKRWAAFMRGERGSR